MVEAVGQEAEAPPKRGRGALVVGLLGFAMFAGGGFWVGWSGLLPLPGGGESASAVAPPPGADAVFVPLERLTVTLGPEAGSRLLRLGATLEIAPGEEAEARRLAPRALDALTTYLQALRAEDLERPAALPRMRAHMLRRLRLVMGEGRVRDLLITEFVLQ